MFTDGSLPDGGSRPRVLAPETQRACAPLVLRVVGLPARAAVQLSTTTVDRRGRRWSAEATYHCGDTVVDVASDASIAGSYLGVDPDGLLTSMRPARARSRGARWFVPSSPNRFPVSVDVRIGGTMVASTTIDRVLVQPGVTSRRFTISSETFGVAWQPPNGLRRRPPVVVLAPARSPMAAHAPGLLASRGYPTVSVVSRSGWPGMTMSPYGRRELRADDLQRGIASGAARAGIDLHGAVLLGVAGGVELAIRLAATLPDLAAVVTHRPAHRPRRPGTAPSFTPRFGQARLGSAGDPAASVSGARAAGWSWFSTEWRRPVGPGRLPGDARGLASQHTGGAAWDLLLDLLRELSISQGPGHADGLTPLVRLSPRDGRGPGRSAR
jgi:hypothetical protein